MSTDKRLMLLSEKDNVFVLIDQIEAGETISIDGKPYLFEKRFGLGQKIARRALAEGDIVLKYGAPIGVTTAAINVGDHVHLHNLKSQYTPTYALNLEQTDKAGRNTAS